MNSAGTSTEECICISKTTQTIDAEIEHEFSNSLEHQAENEMAGLDITGGLSTWFPEEGYSFIAGGFPSDGSNLREPPEVFIHKNGKWNQGTRMNQSRAFAAGCHLADGSWLVIW